MLLLSHQSQLSKEVPSAPVTPKAAAPPVVVAPPAPVVVPPPPAPVVPAVSEVCTQQQQQSRPTTHSSLTTASTSSVSVSPPSPRPPVTQQQFTVHGHFLGPGDHCGPAPNVTVNPHYQPSDPAVPLRPSIQATPPPATDQQIRVLTPSEIMRTLPSLCQENYEPQPPVRTCIQCGRFLQQFSFFDFLFSFFLLYVDRYCLRSGQMVLQLDR